MTYVRIVVRYWIGRFFESRWSVLLAVALVLIEAVAWLSVVASVTR
jgi:hypothetical protein